MADFGWRSCQVKVWFSSDSGLIFASSVLVWRHEWCDSGWEWCQQLDGVLNNQQPNQTKPSKVKLKLNCWYIVETLKKAKEVNPRVRCVVPLAMFFTFCQTFQKKCLHQKIDCFTLLACQRIVYLMLSRCLSTVWSTFPSWLLQMSPLAHNWAGFSISNLQKLFIS